MWHKIIIWIFNILKPEIEPILADYIDSEKDTVIEALKEMDGKTIARLIIHKIEVEL